MAEVLNQDLIIKNIDKLESDGQDFNDTANNMRTTTQNMLDLINQTDPVWKGESKETYTRRFRELEDAMDSVYRLCENYHKKVVAISGLYRKNEKENDEEALRLKTTTTASAATSTTML
ncbi:WXG100 family type VII secretion target [Lachnospiraceae bacterium XBB2008]|nr:WXG100 family type VII secretion target [Lachnospiraceae bacterium XBB2008]